MTTSMYSAHHRDYLVEEFKRRSDRNPNYSLRAYSRDLGLAPSTLSEILKGRYGLSRFKSLAVAKRMNLSPQEAEHFADLFQARRVKGSQQSRDARARIRSRKQNMASNLTMDAFLVVSDWYHFAILELIETDKKSQEPKYLGGRLGIDTILVDEALRRMIDLNILERREGILVPTEDFTGVGEEIPSVAIRKFHRQILEKALVALEFQTVEEREFSSTIMSISKEELPEAKKMMQKFWQTFGKRFGQGAAPKDSVYCLSMQFFNLLTREQE